MEVECYVNLMSENVNSIQQQKKKLDTSKTVVLEVDVEEIKYIFMSHHNEFGTKSQTDNKSAKLC